ncbi:MAG: hypothetical protein ACYTFI_19305 [Planctomycetota bacterium]|jgi:hypothetical protein
MRWSGKWTLAAVIVAVFGLGWIACRETHDSALTDKGLIKASAAELKATVVTPHLEHGIAGGRNVLWCATFQLAWDEVASFIGESVKMQNPDPAVAILNKQTVGAKDLDEASYVALAGDLRGGIYGKIDAALQAKFGGAAVPKLSRSPTIGRPQDIFAYAYLFKNLEFAVPFEDIAEPLPFRGTRVRCFGVGPEKKAPPAMLDQVRVLAYDEDAGTFILELVTKAKGDQLILAKIEPGETLADTIAAVLNRKAEATAMFPHDVLMVPKLNFDLRRRYGELEGRWLIVKNPKYANERLQILSALQDVRFQLDEKGARLRSESHIAIGCSAPPSGRRFVFDGPFLILMKRKEATNPYFAMWVDNAELLVKPE